MNFSAFSRPRGFFFRPAEKSFSFSRVRRFYFLINSALCLCNFQQNILCPQQMIPTVDPSIALESLPSHMGVPQTLIQIPTDFSSPPPWLRYQPPMVFPLVQMDVNFDVKFDKKKCVLIRKSSHFSSNFHRKPLHRIWASHRHRLLVEQDRRLVLNKLRHSLVTIDSIETLVHRLRLRRRRHNNKAEVAPCTTSQTIYTWCRI